MRPYKISRSCNRVSCKWVFKTERDFHGNIEGYKTQLLAKGFTPKMELTIRKQFFLFLRFFHNYNGISNSV